MTPDFMLQRVALSPLQLQELRARSANPCSMELALATKPGFRTMIETDRLILSAPGIGDFDSSLAMHRSEVMGRYTGGTLLSREDVWRKLLQRIGHWTVFGYGVFTVRRRTDNAFIGEVGLAHFCRGFGEAFDAFPEAAWMTDPVTHGQGYAKEAVKGAHGWMTSERGMRQSVCIIHPANMASLRVAEHLGYKQIGAVDYRDARPLMFRRVALSDQDFQPVSS